MIIEAIERGLDRFVAVVETDPVASISAALSPRMLLTFGIVPPPDRLDRQTIAIDDPRSTEAGPGRTVDGFFGSKIRYNVPIIKKRRPAYFDLVIIGPDYRLGERRRILSLLRETAHRRSVVLLLRRPTKTPRRSVRESARGLSRAFRELEMVAALGNPPALLIGALDIATPSSRRPTKRVPLRSAGRALSRFLKDHRIERTDFSARPEVVPDAPGAPSELVRPRYHEIGRAKNFELRPAGVNQRSLGRWWGKDVATLPVALRRFENGLFLPVNGQTQGCLFDADGIPIAASFLWELGFGPNLAAASLENPATCVRSTKGRWHPIQDAGRLRTGEVRPGDFYHFGLLDARFGHFLVENLPRAWALGWALERDMRILVWGESRPFHQQALAMLGVPEERIEVAQPGTTYHRVYSPDPAFRMIGSISPLAAGVWRRLCDAAFDGLPRSVAPEPFLYLSRAGARKRRLTNDAQLEELLKARGGRILRPETLSFDAQIRAVASARAVVGCFGSQLHLSMFQRPSAHKLVIAGEQFLGPDETLISIAADTQVAYYVEPVPRSRSSAARTAAWSIDLDRFGRAFDTWLNDIAAPAEMDARPSRASP